MGVGGSLGFGVIFGDGVGEGFEVGKGVGEITGVGVEVDSGFFRVLDFPSKTSKLIIEVINTTRMSKKIVLLNRLI